MVVSGCHVVEQAADIFTPSKTPNHLSEQEITPLSDLKITSFRETNRHTGEIILLQTLSAAPPTLLSVGQDGRVLGWDLQAGRGYEVKTLQTQPKVVALGENRALMAWADDNGITIGCLQGCSTTITLSKLKVRASNLAFHDLDTSLLIGGLDGRVYRWRFIDDQHAPTTEARERMIERYIGHHTMVSGVVGHSVGRAFFSSDWDGRLIGWLTYTSDDHGGEYDKNIFKGRFYTDLPAAIVAERPADRGITSLAISKDGERVGLGTEDGHVEIWRVKGFSLVARKNLHSGRVINVALSDDGTRIASVGKDSKVRVNYTVPDPTFGISPTALASTLEEVSEHQIPQAHRVAFVTTARLSVGTKAGDVIEVKLEEPAPLPPAPTPKATPKVRDGDY